jgi:uncharacterized protein YgiB involved in biofilm formation
MKKSKNITLLFVSGLLTLSAHAQAPRAGEKPRLFVRSDTTQRYHRTNASTGAGGFFVFRAYGAMQNGRYVRQGYSNPARPFSTPSTPATVSRGGFGRSATVSS